jgi:hypothetical protein
MSFAIHVLSDEPLASITHWQQAIAAAGFDLQLSDEHPFATLQGFLPAQVGARSAGFECYHDDPGALMNSHAGIAFDRPWKHALSFRWGGDPLEGLAAHMAAAAYALAVDGVVFDPEEGRLRKPGEAIEAASEIARYLPTIEAQRSRADDQSEDLSEDLPE